MCCSPFNPIEKGRKTSLSSLFCATHSFHSRKNCFAEQHCVPFEIQTEFIRTITRKIFWWLKCDFEPWNLVFVSSDVCVMTDDDPFTTRRRAYENNVKLLTLATSSKKTFHIVKNILEIWRVSCILLIFLLEWRKSREKFLLRVPFHRIEFTFSSSLLCYVVMLVTYRVSSLILNDSGFMIRQTKNFNFFLSFISSHWFMNRYQNELASIGKTWVSLVIEQMCWWVWVNDDINSEKKSETVFTVDVTLFDVWQADKWQ